MIKCTHCGYQYGWTHKGGKHNEWVEGSNGDFFKLISGLFDEVGVDRFHGGNKNRLGVFGCPSCMKIFMGSEQYKDYDEPNS